MDTKKEFINKIMISMTLEEKIGQMTQYGNYRDKHIDLLKEGKVGSFLNSIGNKRNNEIQKNAIENTRLGIPLLFGDDVIHGFKTIFPIPLAEAASFNLSLIEKSAKLAMQEAYYGGINWIFAPNIDLGNDARFGRIAEGSGEDPYYNSLVAKARIKGFQHQNKVAACAKHYGAYGGVASGRDYVSSKISYHTFLSDHLPPFSEAVKSGVKTIMTSFVDLEAVPFSMNTKCNNDILRSKLGFDGVIVSDWCSIDQLIDFGVVGDKKEAALKSLLASLDVDMHSESYKDYLKELVDENNELITYIDESVRRILSLKYDLGLFTNPYFPADEINPYTNSKELRKHALEIAQNSIVLLKNNNNILPLNSKQKIALIGPFVDDKETHLGCWSYKGDPKMVVSVYEGIKKMVNSNKVRVEKGSEVISISCTSLQQAIEVGVWADVIVLVIGESRDMSGENNCRTNPTIPPSQMALLNELHKLNKPIVSVILAGRPLVINDVDENSDAILYSWHLGIEAGNAIANVLYGKFNPCGKLPISLPYSIGQIPIYYNFNKSCRPKLTRYLDAPNKPLYSFGHGLSYSKFTYSNLVIVNNTITTKDKLKLTIDVTNSGDYQGKEVVQVYFEDLVSSVVTPVKRLCAFKNIKINKNETKTVEFNINPSLFSLINEKYKRVIEMGKFKIMVGGDSENLIEDFFFIVNK